MTALSLPEADSPDVQLVMGTAEEMLRQWRSNSAEWKGPFDVDTYIRREQTLLDQDLTRDGGLTPWFLVHQPDPSQPRAILCGCETFNKRAFVAEKGSVREVVCHGLGSVFCPSQHRGKGYAGKMMSEVAKKLKSWQGQHNAVTFSVLYSDIGKLFYALRGWQVFPSAHISMQASSAQHSQLPPVKLVTAEDIPALCFEDEAILRKRLSTRRPGKTTVAVIPDARTIAWHNARADFIAATLFDRQIRNRGALVDLPDGKQAWCYWQHSWSKVEPNKDNKLYILHIAITADDGADLEAASEAGMATIKNQTTSRAIAALFAAAQAEAAHWGLSSVDYWNPTSLILAAAQHLDPSVSIEHRESTSIASLQWYGEGPWKDVDWVYNERYAWC